jgi:hypothetical protein
MDRQDIDALLIGALYGELTPADEARLAAHLESHPTDRGALDDLKSARQAVRESRIFELQLDPPQALSALLLQEAHRRAPKRVAKAEEKESWFYRFTRSFLAHPAMAAAAMLVLVVGVAGTLYMKKGDQYADKEVLAEAAPQQAAAPELESTVTGTTAEAPADPAMPAGAAGSAYRVGLDDKAPAEEQAPQKLDALEVRGNAELAKQEQQGALRERNEAKNKKASTAIVVDTPRPQPKELPEPRAKGVKAADEGAAYDRFSDGDSVVGGVGSTTIATGGGGAASGRGVITPGAGPSRSAPAQATPPAPPPPPAAAAPAPSTVAESRAPAKPTAKPSVTKEAEKAEAPSADPAPAKDSSLIAWAKAEHSRTVALANKGDCVAAAKAAVVVLNRAPDYYQQFMATDRLLKKCQAYVTAERDAEASRKQQRAPKRATAADEPASSQ